MARRSRSSRQSPRPAPRPIAPALRTPHPAAPGPATATPERRPDSILGLDGLRALSVLAVMAFHAHLDHLGGGFLGVEVFFVISGFLITGLLLKEHARSGGIRFGAFWLRRLWRLMPALLLLLLGVGSYGVLFMGPLASQFRLDLLASVGYLENWHQILSGSSYFADAGLPLLRHLWSLAVEGQFYLVWPLLVAGLLRAGRGRRWPLALAAALLAALSMGLMFGLTDPFASGLEASNRLNRAYLGTHTRALGLLVGALLAIFMAAPRPLPRRRILDGAAALALVGLGLMVVQCGLQSPILYRGGLLLVDGLTAVVLLALGAPGTGWLRRWLGCRPLELIGRRSYGLYLWHWPLFRLLNPEHGMGLPFFYSLLATGLINEGSYQLLEKPERREALRRWWRRSKEQDAFWRRQLPHLAACALIMAGVWETVALAERAPYVDPIQASIQAGATALDPDGPGPGPAPQLPPPAVPAAGEAKDPRTERFVPPTLVVPEDLRGARLTAVGDSVMKGAAIALKRQGEATLGAGKVQINAEECRSFGTALEILRGYKQEHRLGDLVVIHLGTNNSSISETQFRNVMELLADRRLVLFLTAKSDKLKACETVNAALQGMVASCPNARLLDWKALADPHPGYFYADHTHLRPEGAQFYAASILAQALQAPRDHPGPLRVAARNAPSTPGSDPRSRPE